MKYSVVFAVASGLTLASAQLSALPSCALNCAVTSLGSTGCATTDIACICKATAFLAGLQPCVQSACSAADYQTTLTVAQGICSAAGVTLSIPSGAASTAASSASSVSSELSSVIASVTSSYASSTSEAGATSAASSTTLASTTSTTVATTTATVATNGTTTSAGTGTGNFTKTSTGTPPPVTSAVAGSGAGANAIAAVGGVGAMMFVAALNAML